MSSEVITVRLPTDVTLRLRAHAAERGEPASSLAGRLVDEGLRMQRCPGIVFRTGPAGHRAALMRGPDVWEVISVVAARPESGESAIAAAAAQLALNEAEVRAALDYYGAYPGEIDTWIAANERVAERERLSWEVQQRLLA